MTQEDRVLYLLQEGPKTTREFCHIPALAAEYRRAISTLRRKLRLNGRDIVARKKERGCWVYSLVSFSVGPGESVKVLKGFRPYPKTDLFLDAGKEKV